MPDARPIGAMVLIVIAPLLIFGAILMWRILADDLPDPCLFGGAPTEGTGEALNALDCNRERRR